MDTNSYLERINYRGKLTPDLPTLKEIQKAHLLHVPFENLDIHYDTHIKLDIENIYKKIILDQRGGFCYELNGLYYQLLKTIGFEVKRISARVYSSEQVLSPEYDHLTVVVTIDGKEYLSDVGFREFTFSPLGLEIDIIQNDVRGKYIIENHDNDYLKVSRITENEVIPEYTFKNIHREYHEFTEMCRYQQYNPESHFQKQKLISRPTENGRVTLTSTKLKITDNNSVNERPIVDKEDFETELWKHFEIKIN